MKHEEKQQIVAQLNLKVQKTNLSYNKAANQIGVSAALLSNMNSGKWEKISDDKWRIVAAWCGVDAKSWKLRETANLVAIKKLCSDAQNNQRFLAVVDRTGLGKTVSLKWYASNHENAFYMLCTVTMTRKDFLVSLQQALGMEPSVGSIHSRMQSIINELGAKENPLILLDDSGKLSDSVLRLIQVLYDALEFRCGIVLSGTEHFKNYVFKMASKDKLGFRELKRRIGYWQSLHDISRKWLQVVCEDFEVKDPQAVTLVYKMAKDYGSLRELLMNYTRAEKQGKTEVEVLSNLSYGLNNYKQAS
jgi:DNA transposition AAA+ family ATPase